MSWYVAKLVYRIICGEGKHRPQFEEQMRLFEANAPEEAFQKACNTGLAEAVSFHNQKAQLVQWQFVAVADLYALPQATDGAELYSRIDEQENAEGYEALVRQKAARIAAQTTSLQLT